MCIVGHRAWHLGCNSKGRVKLQGEHRLVKEKHMDQLFRLVRYVLEEYGSVRDSKGEETEGRATLPS